MGTRRKTMKDAPSTIHSVPDDLLETLLLNKLTADQLCSLAQVSKRFKSLTECDSLWRMLFEQRYGPPSKVQGLAAKRSGSWRALLASKTVTDKASPWTKACDYETDSAITEMLSTRQLSPSQELALVFLVDGSGSVQEEDFATMTSFITRACQEAADKAPGCKAAVVQFSNDARVEVPLQDVDMDELDKKLTSMVRMNGGTNMQCALQKAGQLLKVAASADSARVVVLLTDGRVDSYQAREARVVADRLADEQKHTQLFAFGVGQGVDRSELLYVLCASGGASAEDRYMDLCVREEAPW